MGAGGGAGTAAADVAASASGAATSGAAAASASASGAAASGAAAASAEGSVAACVIASAAGVAGAVTGSVASAAGSGGATVADAGGGEAGTASAAASVSSPAGAGWRATPWVPSMRATAALPAERCIASTCSGRRFRPPPAASAPTAVMLGPGARCAGPAPSAAGWRDSSACCSTCSWVGGVAPMACFYQSRARLGSARRPRTIAACPSRPSTASSRAASPRRGRSIRCATFTGLAAATGVPADDLVHYALVRWASAGAEALLSLDPQVLDELVSARTREDWPTVAGIIDWLDSGR